MLAYWFLRAETQTAEWRFEDQYSVYNIVQPLEEFFNLVEALHDAVTQLQVMIGKGMSAEAAIAEWERMIKEVQGQRPQTDAGGEKGKNDEAEAKGNKEETGT